VKKKALAIATVTVVSILVTALFVYSQISGLQNQISKLQAQNKELQDQASELQDQIDTLQNQNSVLQDKIDEKYGASPVHIASAELIGWTPIVGLTIASQVNVTVENGGFTDISGLTLTVRLLNNNTDVGDGYVKQINGLRAGEIREFSGAVYYGIDSVFVIESTVKLGGVVLAECIIGR
jgi:type II secretory pathway pseudopilin PulG